MPPPYAKNVEEWNMGEPPIEWDMEKLAEKLGTTPEEVATMKTIDWGWKEFYPARCTQKQLTYWHCLDDEQWTQAETNNE